MRLKVLIFILLSCLAAQAQTETAVRRQHLSVAAGFQFGELIPTNPFVKGDNLLGQPIRHYQAATLKMLWQHPGYTDWQKVFRMPYYGLGLSFGNFFDPAEVGTPVSVYGIFGIPVVRAGKFVVYSEFQFGIASNWHKYDSISNPKNLVIGGGLTVHLNIGFNACYTLTPRLDLGAGISFIHFSNGGMERPNRGFNIYAPSVDLRYHLSPRASAKHLPDAGRLARSNDLFIMLGYGNHQLVEHELDTNYFAIAGLSVMYFDQLSNALRLGAGADINYWFGLNARPDGTIGPRTLDNFTIGLMLQPEIIIDKLTLVGGVGIYAHHLHYGSFNQLYQRLGVRYDLFKNCSLGVNVRAVNFMLAEMLEFNLGYTIRWMK
ncbi:MAG: acyloxyacyl hydrolase [Bacteroidetes bacterium]|nr:acyloxyacyl hydrolase [Bacteroidota bacterium]